MLSKSFEPWTHREPWVSTLFRTLIDRARVRGYWGPSHLVKNMQTLGQFFEPLYIIEGEILMVQIVVSRGKSSRVVSWVLTIWFLVEHSFLQQMKHVLSQIYSRYCTGRGEMDSVYVHYIVISSSCFTSVGGKDVRSSFPWFLHSYGGGMKWAGFFEIFLVSSWFFEKSGHCKCEVSGNHSSMISLSMCSSWLWNRQPQVQRLSWICGNFLYRVALTFMSHICEGAWKGWEILAKLYQHQFKVSPFHDKLLQEREQL